MHFLFRASLGGGDEARLGTLGASRGLLLRIEVRCASGLLYFVLRIIRAKKTTDCTLQLMFGRTCTQRGQPAVLVRTVGGSMQRKFKGHSKPLSSGTLVQFCQ
jgi:hypothetical protein